MIIFTFLITRDMTKTIKKHAILLFLFATMLACTNNKTTIIADYNTVPLPQEIAQKGAGAFVLNKQTKICYGQNNEQQKKNAAFLALYLKQLTGLNLELTDKELSANAIILKNDYPHDLAESYHLAVNSENIVINGADEAGTFHGIQTLRKSLAGAKAGDEVHFPAVEITDYPRFRYRGTHLDVSRHLFSVDEVKTVIDILALHNINYFHWHITDDQGWRIEIKSRPKLTAISSMRHQTVIGKNTSEFDETPYGGFYTQEEVKDIIKYAQDQHITIIPEVDLPGHMVAALAAYPELGCTGGPYEVEGQWGIFEDVLCAGNEEIFTFLEDVYTEIIDLFPSEYINVGGDECPKTRWETCPKCQAKIKELGLKKDAHHTAEEYLQSYVIQRMEKFINSKGRRVIGWDEILEGGIAPDATILSWRGTEGGITAARQHHDVIMVPASHFYFDYYQSQDLSLEPFGIGGYVPVEKVYSFNPLPEELTADEHKYIIGVQANLWVEYIATAAHLQYMYLPRLAALSEIQWLEQDKRDYQRFLPRVMKLTKIYDLLGYKYAEHIFDVAAATESDFEAREIEITLNTQDGARIYYSLDGENPVDGTLYEKPFRIHKTATLKAVALRDGEASRVFEKTYNINKATFKNIALKHAPSTNYVSEQTTALVDGIQSTKAYNTGEWLGFYGNDLDVIVDLEETTEISEVKIGNYISLYDVIFPATKMQVYVSEDNETFTEVYNAEITERPSEKKGNLTAFTASFNPVNARYVHIVSETVKAVPDWMTWRAGRTAFQFVDEITIN
jgi:hexosaminidase